MKRLPKSSLFIKLLYCVLVASTCYLMLLVVNFSPNLHSTATDPNLPTTKPWAKYEDGACRHYQINFAKINTSRPRALISFPGSGNSWLRYLIECSTGFFTGSVVNEPRIYAKGLLGETRCPEDGTTILQKTHDHSPLTIFNKCRQNPRNFPPDIFSTDGILIIRNPFDALVSSWNLKQSYDQTGHADESTFSSDEWKNFVANRIPRWSSLITNWLEVSGGRLLIVEYEKLVNSPRKELVRIMRYLNLPVDEGRLDCLLERPGQIEGPFHRKPNTSKTLDTLDKNKFNSNGSKTSQFFTPGLTLLVQEQVSFINGFFLKKKIPIFLEYRVSRRTENTK